jgi:sec-independent protein translocase protein TatC
MLTGEISGGFWDHLSDLRSHLLWGFFILLTTAILFFSFGSNWVILKLIEPLPDMPLVFLTPLGPFLFKLQVSVYAALLISMPALAGVLLHFISPALSPRQVKAVLAFGLSAIALSALAAWSIYAYALPYTLSFLLSLTVPGTSFFLTAESYLNFMLLQMLVGVFLVQIPLLITLSSYLRLIDPRHLARQRRHLYVGLLIILALLTPTTDAFTLLLAFVPAIILLEIGLWYGSFIYRKEIRYNISHGSSK